MICVTPLHFVVDIAVSLIAIACGISLSAKHLRNLLHKLYEKPSRPTEVEHSHE